MNPGFIGRILLAGALILAAAGLVFLALDRLGIDRIPGNFVWRRDNLRVYVPIGLMILLSILLTVLLNLFFRR